jgi:aspartyl-tRNA synthetase
MLTAFGFGVPPHAGIAPGLDRLLMILCGAKHIREVIAFPKNKEARDVLMGAPSVVDKAQLDDVHVGVKKVKEKKK